MFFVQEFRRNDYIKNEKISKNYADYKRKTVVSVSKKLQCKDVSLYKLVFMSNICTKLTKTGFYVRPL